MLKKVENILHFFFGTLNQDDSYSNQSNNTINRNIKEGTNIKIIANKYYIPIHTTKIPKREKK